MIVCNPRGHKDGFPKPFTILYADPHGGATFRRIP
jgi:hypothetical protein